MESFYKNNGYPIYLNSSPYYLRSLKFHLDKRAVPRYDLGVMSEGKKVYRNGNYFLIYPTNSNLQRQLNKNSSAYDEAERREFGTLVVIRLVPREGSITDIEREIEVDRNSKDAPGVPKRYTWDEIFEEDATEEDVEEEDL